jgi:hypothetical protein
VRRLGEMKVLAYRVEFEINGIKPEQAAINDPGIIQVKQGYVEAVVGQKALIDDAIVGLRFEARALGSAKCNQNERAPNDQQISRSSD